MIGSKTVEAKRAQQTPRAAAALDLAAANTPAYSGRRRSGGQVREPSSSALPAPAAPDATGHAHNNPLQVAFTNAALSIALALQQNMARQQQQIALLNSFPTQQQQLQPMGLYQGQVQQQQHSLYGLLPPPTLVQGGNSIDFVGMSCGPSFIQSVKLKRSYVQTVQIEL